MKVRNEQHNKPLLPTAPIIAAALLLLPVLYVGSYLALVKPGPIPATGSMVFALPYRENYRSGGLWESRFFWPLEQVDRKLRREAWEIGPD